MTRAAPARGEWLAAAVLPVARVVVDVALPHLDRPFDYLVPTQLDDVVTPGVRLRVRFAGRLVDGFVLERVAGSAHAGRLAWVEKVVSPEPALTPEIAAVCRGVADRYGGVLADVVRLALPPRHARVEREPQPEVTTDPRAPQLPGAPRPPGAREPDGVRGWARYPRGPAFLTALAAGRAAHAVWQALPGEDPMARLAEAAATAVEQGRGALLVVPDQRDVDALHAACVATLGPSAVVALTAELGPAERYRRWLAVRRGRVRVVVGTRSAAFAPVAELALLAVWDDGDDLHAEPRAPYPHVRDVLTLRAHQVGAALLVAGFARTAEGQLLVDTGWAREIVADRAEVRAAMPRVAAQADGEQARDPLARAARLPAAAFEAARAALAAGRPVLVQVPRAGYLTRLACARCREPARCRRCAGPLEVPPRRAGAPGTPGAAPPRGTATAAVDATAAGRLGGRAAAVAEQAARGGADGGSGAELPRCRWCGRAEPAFRCGACGARGLRAGVVGADRTAEELGRAFPGVPVRGSGGGAPVVAEVAAGPAIVVATPGAEPRAAGGYGAALLLDGWALLARPDLRVAEETLRRWMAAAALVVPHTAGGRVLVMADAALPPVQALVRWDAAGHAAVELAARAEVGFPPARRLASVEGSPAALAELLAELPDDIEVLGPVEIEAGPGPPGDPTALRERVLLRVPRSEGRTLAAVLHAVQAARSARKATESLRVRLDPHEIG